MGSYAIIGALIFMAIFVVTDLLNQKQLTRIAKKASLQLANNKQIGEIANLNRNHVSLYLLDNSASSFKPIDEINPEIYLSELSYKNTGRFTNLIEGCIANQPGKGGFFRHNSNRHLIYPFKDSSNSIRLLLVAKRHDSISDLIQRK